MPLFEYRCKKCSHVTTVLEKAGSKKKHVCEKCGSKETEKIFSTFAAQSGGGKAGSCPSGTCSLG
ncbi:MAG: zinc ribbon domain-containing protein [Phycisphaerae bacterium]|nr:zinc ribbon domain-containing protein [Phycisphaerae bacterium]